MFTGQSHPGVINRSCDDLHLFDVERHCDSLLFDTQMVIAACFDWFPEDVWLRKAGKKTFLFGMKWSVLGRRTLQCVC
eukprot:m.25113 g.25113  ORF g.25113 m.25113 type:complete len:78 (+) comp28739_c0_seq3:1028-1261(+)